MCVVMRLQNENNLHSLLMSFPSWDYWFEMSLPVSQQYRGGKNSPSLGFSAMMNDCSEYPYHVLGVGIKRLQLNVGAYSFIAAMPPPKSKR